MSRRLPRLCLHKAVGQYYIRIKGRPVYLGKAGGPEDEARAEAGRLRVLAEYGATGRLPGKESGGGPTVDVLLAAYMTHVEAHYRKPDGTPTSEQRVIRMAVRPLQRLYGPTPAAGFGPLALQALQAAMADGSWMGEADRAKAKRGAWCRRLVNRNVNRVRRLFKWAVGRELVPPSVWQSLRAVPPLLAHRTAARETGDVPAAPEESVEAVRGAACRQVRDMIDVQLLTGARPGEVCSMRPADLDRTGEALARLLGVAVPLGRVWAYLPGLGESPGGPTQDHKTAHHGRRRVVPVGPRAQAVLAPYLGGRAPDAPLFSPAEARAERYALMRSRRKTPVQPSQESRAKKVSRKAPGPRYTPSSYAHAVAGALRRLNRARAGKGLPPLPHWHPHQLRKNAATRIERQFGLKVAQTVCGHSSLHTTARFYVQADLESAFRAVEDAG